MGGAQAVFDVPEVSIFDEDGAANADEFRRIVAHVGGLGAEGVSIPRMGGRLCECARGADIGEAPVGSVAPNSSVAVDLVGLFGIGGGQWDENESVGACDSLYGHMLAEAQRGSKVIWENSVSILSCSKLGSYGSFPHLAAAFPP